VPAIKAATQCMGWVAAEAAVAVFLRLLGQFGGPRERQCWASISEVIEIVRPDSYNMQR
jgi:hypothetical protein